MSKRQLIITAIVVVVILLFLVYGLYNGVPGGRTEDGTGL
jgi:hypothetical protein